MQQDGNKVSEALEHHKRLEYCHNRLKYRNGKKLTAVKVYTVANESRHLLVFGIPRINLKNEVKKLFQKWGDVTSVECVSDEIIKEGIQLELFTDCFHVVFEKIENSRKAKKFNDAKNFYGGILHISYAPERESLEETRAKIEKRKMEVLYRLRVNSKVPTNEPESADSMKRKSSFTNIGSNQPSRKHFKQTHKP